VDLHREVEERRVLEAGLVHGACGLAARRVAMAMHGSVAAMGLHICDVWRAEHGCCGGKWYLWHLVLPSSSLDLVASLPDLAVSTAVVA
jgi:hypothetical protein